MVNRIKKPKPGTPKKKNKNTKGVFRLMKKDNRCYYCRIEMKKPDGTNRHHNDVATLEHKHPISKGGKKGVNTGNVVLACMACNRNKGNMTEEEYYASPKFIKRHNTLNWCNATD